MRWSKKSAVRSHFQPLGGDERGFLVAQPHALDPLGQLGVFLARTQTQLLGLGRGRRRHVHSAPRVVGRSLSSPRGGCRPR